jgi:hypothetical protein
MRLTIIISLLITNILFSQKIKGRYKLINIDSTNNFYILKFTSKKIDSLNCFFITSSKSIIYNGNRKLKIKKKYLLEINKASYDILDDVDNIDAWGVENKTIWKKGDKCKVYFSNHIDGLYYRKN